MESWPKRGLMSNIITDLHAKPVGRVNKPVASLGHGKFSFVDKDLKGKVIQTTAKSRKSIEVEGDSRFAGHRFVLGTKLYGDKRCIYCGIWFHWKDTDYQTWIKTGNIDRLNLDDNIEPLHCGSDHCEEYHRLCVKAEEDRLRRTNERTFEMYKSMQAKGLVD